ncbi:MAG TPA: formate dehydrogenase accessory sulfurtransferase FdhD, partial [Desulfobacteraceae bacterium]|nr:formate dehydrogenase accessory sulfurtransferase FdhD [Desulfobacteraceae bacterium]
TITVNSRELATLLASPDHIKNLVTGFLYTAGLLQEISSFKSIIIDRDRWNVITEIDDYAFNQELVFKRVYTSGCGKGVIFHNPIDLLHRTKMDNMFSMESLALSELMKKFQTWSREHSVTRGVHSGALASCDGILIFRDDIGRHNALDKVIGEALSTGTDFTDKILLTSGRISSEILSKVLRCRMPVIAAIGSPTNQAVKLARDANLTLVGNVRGGRMNIYSSEERIC